MVKFRTIWKKPSLPPESFLARRGRFHEAEELFADRIGELLDEEGLADWQLNRAKLLAWQGKVDEASEVAAAQVNTWRLSIPSRWLLFDLMVQGRRWEAAAALVDDLDGVIRQYANEIALQEVLELQRGLAAYLRAELAIHHQDWEAAFAHFQNAAKVSDAYADNWHMLYRMLVLAGQTEWANRALNREASEASQRFWRGLNGFYAGDEKGARVEWEMAAALPIDNIWVRSATDWILAHYYLGDEQRLGLELSLRLLQRSQTGAEPVLLVLAALGWALRQDWNSMRTNLTFAQARYREAMQDALLPELYGRIARDLLPAERFAEIEGYFRKPV